MTTRWIGRRAPAGSQPPADTLNEPRTAVDTFAYAVILALGGMAYALTLRASDFFTGDTIYFELARSLLSGHGYGFNFQPETVLPPGFPALMASLCAVGACGHTVFIRAIVVCSTLGLLTTYELLRREEGRAVAVGICLLIGSAPFWFVAETRIVFSDLPYVFTSMLSLVMIRRLDEANTLTARAITWILCGVSLAASVLLRSAGIALIGGLVLWLAASSLTDPRSRARRLRLFLPLAIAAVVIQGTWMRWVATHEVVEWPIGGYPRSYLSQLHVKSGNDPELGAATLADIPARVAKNLTERVAGSMTLLTRQEYVNPVWSSPLVLYPLLLILVGWAGSVWQTGGSAVEWYFAGHEAIYLVWPWDLEMRFLLPVVPLTGLYIWRGGKILVRWMIRRPRLAAAWTVPLALVAAVHAGAFAWDTGSRQLAVATIFWVFAAIASVVVLRMDQVRLEAAIDGLRRLRKPIPWTHVSISAIGMVLLLWVATQVGVGVDHDAKLGRENASFDVTKAPSYPDVEAGEWLAAHTDSAAIVMARQVDVVFHYSRRRVVWFPPISDPSTLMLGIHKYGVRFVVVNHRTSSYWRPPEEDCFTTLLVAYPQSFRLIEEGPQFRIFQVM